MSVQLIVGTQVINFPNAGADASWAPAVIQFAQAVTEQLATLSSQFDISPRVQTLTSDANTNLNISGAIFPDGSVRSFRFTYSIYRTNGVTSLVEEGIVSGVFDTLNATWDLQRDFQGPRQSNGIPYHMFSISGDQIQLSTVAMGGSYDSITSEITYSAKTLTIVNP